MNPRYKVHNTQLTLILTHDGEFVDYGFIVGLELVGGEIGWFPSIILLTVKGELLQGYRYMIRPDCPHLQLEFKPLLLEWHDASRVNSTG